MTSRTNCTDAFHGGDSDGIEYEAGTAGGVSLTGYECPSCGFRTVTTETYVPLDKQCVVCGAHFRGLPDAPDEPCDACFARRLDSMEWKP